MKALQKLTALLLCSGPLRSTGFVARRTRPTVGPHQVVCCERIQQTASSTYSTTTSLHAKPKRGSVVDTYQTVSVNCAKCRERLFRYKKKNGTKSNLIKCFVERIAEDSAHILRDRPQEASEYACPNCQTVFARDAVIRGLPALKLVGGKTRMSKK